MTDQRLTDNVGRTVRETYMGLVDHDLRLNKKRPTNPTNAKRRVTLDSEPLNSRTTKNEALIDVMGRQLGQ